MVWADESQFDFLGCRMQEAEHCRRRFDTTPPSQQQHVGKFLSDPILNSLHQLLWVRCWDGKFGKQAQAEGHICLPKSC